MAFRARVQGVVMVAMMFLSSFLGAIFMMGPVLPVFVVMPGIGRAAMDQLTACWEHFTAALLEIFLGMRVVITGDRIQPGERNLLIMNHRTRLDWMYLWSVLLRQSGLTTEKIILKKELKHIPGAGWAMQSAGFIFIERKWEVDRPLLATMVEYFSGLKHNTQILLFPEGTDLTLRTKARSDEFARKNHLIPYKYVLHPRTTGFTYLAHKMSSVDHLDAIYDLTVAYPYNCPQTEPEFFGGNFPKEVHFHVKRYPIANIPQSEDGLKDWCCQRWAEKEDRLKKFYTDLCFTEGSETCPGKGKSAEKNNNEGQPVLMLYIAIVYWTLYVIGCVLLLVYSSMARWFALVVVSSFLALGYKGGLEKLQVYWYNRVFSRKNL